LAPKGEFFTKDREKWMPEIPGEFVFSRGIVSVLWDWSVDYVIGTFQKNEIKT
jgi:hypothetical protein